MSKLAWGHYVKIAIPHIYSLGPNEYTSERMKEEADFIAEAVNTLRTIDPDAVSVEHNIICSFCGMDWRVDDGDDCPPDERMPLCCGLAKEEWRAEQDRKATEQEGADDQEL